VVVKQAVVTDASPPTRDSWTTARESRSRVRDSPKCFARSVKDMQQSVFCQYHQHHHHLVDIHRAPVSHSLDHAHELTVTFTDDGNRCREVVTCVACGDEWGAA
jgi:hypothetical protein